MQSKTLPVVMLVVGISALVAAAFMSGQGLSRGLFGGGLGGGLIVVLVGAYFLPTVIAWRRHCRAMAGIAVVNVFLGWTLLGWVAALAWSVSGEIQTAQF